MTDIKRLIGTLISCLPLILYAQQEEKGIKWVIDLSWNQVKQKAKAENKYIFIDAYATWCGPCKMMDKAVYSNDTVGNFYNDKFISIKVQMDKTKKDDDYVKGWYSDAEAIQKSYYVDAYPSFIFLSPEGSIVHMAKGYTDVPNFVLLAKTALTPGKIYQDPYVEYRALVEQYKQGVKNYERIPYMFRCAIKLKERDFAYDLVKDHLNNYAKIVSKKKRYTKDAVEMWNMVSLSIQTSIFKFFYEDGKIIDKIMGQKGYAEEKVDATIRYQFLVPFFEVQNKDSTVSFRGMYATGGKLKPNYADADWKKLEDTLKANFKKYYAEKNLLWAKGEWYRRNRNDSECYKYTLEYDRKYPIKDDKFVYKINGIAFDAFKKSTNKEVIDGYIKLLGGELKNRTVDPRIYDTYANLLYKAGRTKEAISWETKAVNESIGDNADVKELHTEILELMKKGEHTWGKSVVWGYE